MQQFTIMGGGASVDQHQVLQNGPAMFAQAEGCFFPYGITANHTINFFWGQYQVLRT